jgi:hypothetical protein
MSVHRALTNTSTPSGSLLEAGGIGIFVHRASTKAFTPSGRLLGSSPPPALEFRDPPPLDPELRLLVYGWDEDLAAPAFSATTSDANFERTGLLVTISAA